MKQKFFIGDKIMYQTNVLTVLFTVTDVDSYSETYRIENCGNKEWNFIGHWKWAHKKFMLASDEALLQLL
jgi:hypothetical protein